MRISFIKRDGHLMMSFDYIPGLGGFYLDSEVILKTANIYIFLKARTSFDFLNLSSLGFITKRTEGLGYSCFQLAILPF